MRTRTRRRYAPRLPPEERRAQLLDATLRLIASDGYGGASMEGVAREAGVTKPVVYDLFPNRGVLLQALLEREENRAFSELAAVLPTALPTDADPDEVLREGVEAFVRAIAQSPETWRLILLPVEGTPEVVREHVDRGRQVIARQIETLVAWGVERRGGPEGMDIELAAQAILAFSEHAGRLTLTAPDRFTPERLGAFVAGFVALLPRA